MTDPPRVAAVVLAAGAASRFGSPKLRAPLAGKPVLQHALDTLAEAGVENVVVVLGASADDVEAAVRWRTERRIRNPRPDDGLASSLRLGLEAVTASMEGALIVLGDQPTLRYATILALLAAPVREATLAVVPVYGEGGGANPVLLLRAGFGLIERVAGDQGLGALLGPAGEAVVRVPILGANPDVDTPTDLAAIAAEAWADRVRANREQVDRLREVPDGPDFYGAISSLFRADPRRTDDPVLDLLLEGAKPGQTWLDVGAGAGRYALPLAMRVRQVTAVDPSAAMLAALEEIAAEHAIVNVRSIEARWPMAGAPTADRALIAHVGYDIEAIGSFLDALEAAAPDGCVAIMMDRTPASAAEAFWPPVHEEARVPLPALPDFLQLLESRGVRPQVSSVPRPPTSYASFDEVLAFARRQTWVEPGGVKDGRLLAELHRVARQTPDGWTLPAPDVQMGVVRWVRP